MGKMGEAIYDENGNFVEAKPSLEAWQWAWNYLSRTGELDRLAKIEREKKNKKIDSKSKVS